MATQPPPADKAYEIPIVSFRVITNEPDLLIPAGVHSEQARSYGYNDFSDFERPEHYIRYIEPIESELAVQVEYDMDEQDQEWLDAVNAERTKEQSGPVTYEVFEILMDKLEKEWFSLIKRIPQPASHLPVEDSKCAICDDGEGENANAIVFCDGCNLAVHQDCYGVPYIPEGQWLCRKCTVSPENPVSCLFCPNEGGAFKQTTTGHWAHLLCAIWIPELGVGNAIYMEPVEGVENVPKNRWKLVCSLCKERVGACIQCENKSCFTAFHVTCARQTGLLMSMKLMGADGQMKAYCEKHLPAGWREGKLEDEDEEDDDYYDSEDDTPPPKAKRPRKDSTTARAPAPAPVTTKTARAHAKSYRPGPPIVPRMIVNRLLDYVAKVSIRKRQPFIERMCRYWSLKREARRGAPLLKRLHLEPWTATGGSGEQTEAEKAKKLEYLVAVRNDLEKVRLLAELVRKREKEKLRQAQVIKEVVDNFIFPQYAVLYSTLEKIVAMDRGELFLNPVNPAEITDYLDVVKEPMSWSEIDDKLRQVVYSNVEEFKRDILLTLDNAMLYNKSDSPFHRTAGRLKKNVRPLLDELDVLPPLAALMPSGDEFIDPPPGTVGDLEPSLLRLQTLLAPDPVDRGRDLLASIFTFEVERPKSPTPPPPPPQPKRSRKSLNAAERKQRWEEREQAYKERQSMGGYTRTAKAAANAAAAELGIEAVSSPPPPLPESSRKRSARRETRTQTRAQPQTPPPPEEDIDAGDDAGPSDPADASSPGTIKPLTRHEPGVLGVLSVPVLSERERRELERKLDLVADNIDTSDEYKRFNVGWILPEGAKRRRPQPPPPPLKKRKRERPKEGRQESEETTMKVETDVSVEKATTEERTENTESTGRPSEAAEPHEDEADGTGKQLDEGEESALSEEEPDEGGPSGAAADAAPEATERDRKATTPVVPQTPLRDRKGKARALTDDDEDLTPIPTPTRKRSRDEETPRPAKKPRSEDDDDLTPPPEEALRSSLSPPPGKMLEDEEEEGARGVEAAVGETEVEERERRERRAREPRVPDPSDDFPADSKVWAKVPSYPYFPGIVVDHVGRWDTVPQAALDMEEEANARERAWLVRFYDKQRSYAWVHRDKLDGLGVDDAVDKMYLAGKERGRNKGFKSSHVRASCRKAFTEAKAAIDAEKVAE